MTYEYNGAAGKADASHQVHKCKEDSFWVYGAPVSKGRMQSEAHRLVRESDYRPEAALYHSIILQLRVSLQAKKPRNSSVQQRAPAHPTRANAPPNHK